MSEVNAGNIQFWKVIEATAKLAACSIKAAEFTGNDATALHNEGVAALQAQLQKLVGDNTSEPSTQEPGRGVPNKPRYFTSEVALEIARETLPQVREALQKRGFCADANEWPAIIVALMATSLAD